MIRNFNFDGRRAWWLAAQLATLALAFAGAGSAQPYPPTMEKLAEGVYFLRHRGEGGSATVVIGSRDVLVVDASGGAGTRWDIEQIKKLTDRPVRYLVNSHWHGDHNAGNSQYMEAFPGVAILAHPATKFEMDLLFPKGKERTMREVARLKVELQKTTDKDGKPLTAAQLEANKREYERMERIEREAVTNPYSYQPPTVTFEHSMDIDLGGRVVQLRHLGKGNTAGDVIAYIPDAKVLAAGDLLVHPIPYMFDGYPSEWVKTLDKLAAYDTTVIVPGHGWLLRDKEFVFLVRDFLQAAMDQLNRRLADIGPAEFAEFDQVKDAFDLSSFKPKFLAKYPEFEESYVGLERRVKMLVFREAQLR